MFLNQVGWRRSKSEQGNPPHIALYVMGDSSKRSCTAMSEVTWKTLVNSVMQTVKHGLGRLLRAQRYSEEEQVVCFTL